MVECSFCHKTYSSEYTLKTHQQSTKSCLAIQEKLGINIVKCTFDCQYCHKVLTTKKNLTYHLKTCKEKQRFDSKDAEIQRLASEQKIKELEEKLSKLPSTIINNTHNDHSTHINIYNVMTPEHVLDIFQKHYRLDTLLGGQKALARFVNDEFLRKHAEPLYVCGDRSRHKFYILDGKKKVEDANCEHLIELTTKGFPHVQDVYEEAMFNELPANITEKDVHIIYQHLINMPNDHHEFKSELSKVVLEEGVKEPQWKDVMRIMQERNQRLFGDITV